MGVPGLWDLIRKAGIPCSLSSLSYQAFKTNRNGRRALVIGIDAAIWVFHAQIPVHGENPFLRTIFYKITALLQQPVLPVFVFDGPRKPSQKRNQYVGGHFGTADQRSRDFKALLDVCGLEWWNAPGEAEAELAVMNRQGKIDAVLSDDGDALLFGATCLIRNNSPTLSGAQVSSTQNNSKADHRQYEVFRSSAIRTLWAAKAGTKLESEDDDQLAMILIALLAGGDYAPEGISNFGPTVAFGLANAGFASSLKLFRSDRQAFFDHLPQLRDNLISELKTNASKQIGRKNPDKASKLAATDSLFPLYALEAYLTPATSPRNDSSQGWPGFEKGESSRGRGKAVNGGRGSLEGMARACELYFEWGTKDLVVKKFMGDGVGLFGIEVLNEARQAILRNDRIAECSERSEKSRSANMEHAGPPRITSFFGATQRSAIAPKSKDSCSSKRARPDHITKIHSVRVDPTTRLSDQQMNEYRISFIPETYITRCRNAMSGNRVDPKYLPIEQRQALGLVERASPEDEDEASADLGVPTSTGTGKEIRVWMAEYMVEAAFPELVREYEESKIRKLKSPVKKSAAGKGRQRGLDRPGIGNSKGKGKVNVKMKEGLKGSGQEVDRFMAFFKQPAIGRDAEADLESEEIEQLEHLENLGETRRRTRSPSILSVDKLLGLPGSQRSKSTSRSRSRSRSRTRSDLLVPVPSPSPAKKRSASPTPTRTMLDRTKDRESRPLPMVSTSSLTTLPSSCINSSPPRLHQSQVSSSHDPVDSDTSPLLAQKSSRRGKNVIISPSTSQSSSRPSRRAPKGRGAITRSTSITLQLSKGGKDDPVVLSDSDDTIQNTPLRTRPTLKSKPKSTTSVLGETSHLNRTPTPSNIEISNPNKGNPKGKPPRSSKSPRRVSPKDARTGDQQLLGFPVIARSRVEEVKEKKEKRIAVPVKSTEEVDYFNLTDKEWEGGDWDQ